MSKIAIGVHGGAGPDSALIKNNLNEYHSGIREAILAGYRILEKGGTSVDAVQVAVACLEDNALFNAGKGSVLNEDAQVEMEASIMRGRDLACGAVSLARQIKNPIVVARALMEEPNQIFLGGQAVMDLALALKSEMRPESYFVTDYNYEQFE